MSILLVSLIVLLFFLLRKAKRKIKRMDVEVNDLKNQCHSYCSENERMSANLDDANQRIFELRKYEGLVDIEAEILRKKSECESEIADAKKSASEEIEREKIIANAAVLAAKDEAKVIREKSKNLLEESQTKADFQIKSANSHAQKLISDAEAKAKDIAGNAFELAGKANELEKTVIALKNIVHGYGTQYLKPTYSLLDELAADFSHTDAGQKLKEARDNSDRMVRAGLAATCDYVQADRKETAVAFVVDAFNGKVDSILTKTKKDNYGTLEQKIRDAFYLVNHNGTAFRNAKITTEYLNARLEELKWGTIVSELKVRAQEEQRRLREQIREEERARREFDKAMKDAAKEEEMLRKAMEKAQQQIATATETKKAEFEAKLADLQKKLEEAEERGKRALSMAQQTKHGNVYVISNIGSFGENVYKVGMTRRLDPMDRVRELGDASVPFPFDVHAIIESDDAPALESKLHKALSLMQVNKVNSKKEFFRVQLSDIRKLVESSGLTASWTNEAEATEYRETLVLEEQMRNDPAVQKKWENYIDNLSDDDIEAC